MQERFGAEEAKSVEMAAELLTLVNQKTHLDAVGGCDMSAGRRAWSRLRVDGWFCVASLQRF